MDREMEQKTGVAWLSRVERIRNEYTRGCIEGEMASIIDEM